MAKNRKKKRIKWSGVALLTLLALLCLAAIVGLGWGIVWGVSRLLGSGHDTAKAEQAVMVQIDPAELQKDSIMESRVAQLVESSHQLDTTLLGICLYDATTDRMVYEYNGDERMIPASCMKVPTAIAALELLGMDHVYETTLRVQGTMVGDTLEGRLVLQADDDPLLMSFDTLVYMMRKTGIHAIRGSVECDLAREDKVSSHPTTQSYDIKNAKLSLLMHDKAWVESALLSSLQRHDVTYMPSRSVPQEGEWHEVARWETPLTEALAPMLIYSSNAKAESIFFHLDCHEQLIRDRHMHWEHKHAVQSFWEKAIFEGKRFDRRLVRNMAGAVMLDGSGLSHKNRLSPYLLVQMLRYAWDREPLRSYLIDKGLASPGDPVRRGSLTSRMTEPALRNRVFVKTGTLGSIGISSLSGYIHGKDDHWYVFSLINQDCPVMEGRLFQDAFCRLFVR